MTVWQLPDSCLLIAWQLTDKCPTTAWYIPKLVNPNIHDFFDQLERVLLVFLFLCYWSFVKSDWLKTSWKCRICNLLIICRIWWGEQDKWIESWPGTSSTFKLNFVRFSYFAYPLHRLTLELLSLLWLLPTSLSCKFQTSNLMGKN